MRVFTLGDIKHDTFVALPTASVLCKKQSASCTLCFAYGEKIPVGAFFSQTAGTAPNVAISLSKLGHEAGIFSTLGTAKEHDEAISFLKQEGVNTSSIQRNKHQIMSSAVVINFKGESTQLVSHTITKHTLPKRLPSFDLLHISELGDGYRTIFKEILRYAKKGGVRISINPGTVQIRESSKELLELMRIAEILFVNVKEAMLLTKLPESTSQKTLLAGLHKLCPNTIVMTDGLKGAYALHQKKMFFAKSFPGERVETTGAGDAFSAGVLAALLTKKGVSDALAWGSVNAASVVGYVGPTAGLLTQKEITKRLNAEKSYRVTTYS